MRECMTNSWVTVLKAASDTFFTCCTLSYWYFYGKRMYERAVFSLSYRFLLSHLCLILTKVFKNAPL